jgi:hypothetical protein
MAGCASSPVPPADAQGWHRLTPEDAHMYGTGPGWFDFAANESALTHLVLPELGPVTVMYMPHGNPARPAWVERQGRWECCADVPVALLGHGGAWQGMRYHDWAADESAIELAVHPAGLEGFIGLAGAEPEGRPVGDYLLRFRLATGDGAIRQELRIERVECRVSAVEVAWYGCGTDPVMREGDVAPM